MDFFTHTLSEINEHHSEWWKHTSGRPICIPNALDIFTKFRGPRDIEKDMFPEEAKLSVEEAAEALKHMNNIHGDDGEVAVLWAFQRSNIGGILIANFDSKEFYKNFKEYDTKTGSLALSGDIQEQMDKYKNEFIGKEKDFQCDFIYIHPHYGIFVIEVNNFVGNIGFSCESVVNENDIVGLHRFAEKRFKMTSKPNYIEKVTRLHEIFMNNTYRSLGLPLPSGVLFFPSANIQQAPYCSKISREDKDLPPIFLHVLDKKSVRNLEQFLSEVQNFPDFSISDNLLLRPAYQRFVSALVFYRPEIFSDIAANTQRINQMINYGCQDQVKADLLKKREMTALQGSGGYRLTDKENAIYMKPISAHAKGLRLGRKTFFLNDEQFQVYLNTNQRKLLFGRQGTGKSLLIKLLFQKCCEMYKDSKIYVLTGAAHMKTFFEEECERYNCTVILDPENISKVEDSDHFFSDEVTVSHGEWHEFLAKRAKLANVCTIVAVCGRFFLDDADGLKRYFDGKVKNIDEFEKVQLRQAFRSTRAICQYCTEKGLLKPSTDGLLGHNVHGSWPIDEVLPTAKQVMEKVVYYLQQLLSRSVSKNIATGMQLEACDIAILLNAFDSAEEDRMRQFLCENSFACQKCDGKDRNKIILEKNISTLSFEATVVIVVNLTGHPFWRYYATGTLQPTRARAQLIVLSRDRMAVQRMVDQRVVNCDLATVTRAMIEKELKSVHEELNEDDAGSISWYDKDFTLLRYDINPYAVMDDDYNKGATVVNYPKCSNALLLLCNDENLMQELILWDACSAAESLSYSFDYILHHNKQHQLQKTAAAKVNQKNMRSVQMQEAFDRFSEQWIKNAERMTNNADEWKLRITEYQKRPRKPFSELLPLFQSGISALYFLL